MVNIPLQNWLILILKLPLEKVEAMIYRGTNEKDPAYLQYGSTTGYDRARKIIANKLSEFYKPSGDKYDIEIKVKYSNLFITSGISQALHMLISLIGLRNDKGQFKRAKIFVEEPKFFLDLIIFKDFGFEAVYLPVDSDGLIVDRFEEEMSKIDPDTRVILYTVPTFHNPVAVTLSHERRLKLMDIARRNTNLYIFADEVYQLLYFSEEKVPPHLAVYNSDYSANLISLVSFSKIFAPALRLGWLETTPKIIDELSKSGLLDSSGGLNPVILGIVENAIELGHLDSHLFFAKDELRKRSLVIKSELNKLKTLLKDRIGNDVLDFTDPQGGYFIWVTFKNELNNVDTKKLLDIAEKYKIRFNFGNFFAADKSKLKNCLRLSFSYYNEEDLKLGMDRFSEMIISIFWMMKRILRQTLVKDEDSILKTKDKFKKTLIFGYTGKLGSLISSIFKDEYGLIFGSDFFGINSKTTDEEFQDLTEKRSYDLILNVSNECGINRMFDLLKKTSYKPDIILGGTADIMPYDKIKEYRTYGSVDIYSNFSAGIPFISDIVDNIKKKLPLTDCVYSLEETHHTSKIDVSGTAKMLRNKMGFSEEDLPITSIREGDTVGTHVIVMENSMERIEIKHVAKDRKIFAQGAVSLCKE